MNNIVCKVAALGGTISTTDISHLSEYKRLLRAKERGDLIKLRHGIYAVPDALLNTMIDVERIVPNGIVCLYNAWAYHQLSTTVPPAFCIAIANKRKVYPRFIISPLIVFTQHCLHYLDLGPLAAIDIGRKIK